MVAVLGFQPRRHVVFALGRACLTVGARAPLADQRAGAELVDVEPRHQRRDLFGFRLSHLQLGARAVDALPVPLGERQAGVERFGYRRVQRVAAVDRRGGGARVLGGGVLLPLLAGFTAKAV